MNREINAGIDYNAIYDTAVNELGMVYPRQKSGNRLRFKGK